MMKMFEQTVESGLEDSSGEHTEAERNSRDRPADAVGDVICDVTHEMQSFRAQNKDKKSQSCSERYEGAQAVTKSPCQ